MGRFAWLATLAAAAGCAASVAHVRLAVELTGAGANPAAKQRCLEAVRQAGGIADAQASMHALITVEPNGNRVQVLSDRRGLVHDQLDAQAPVEVLCSEAVAAATSATRREPLPAPAGPSRAEGPLANPTASGGAYQGPISDQ